ncbi:hypothetical protein [Pedobacter chinensis]|uniref:hypothetical protein n=1 Tax=Pedobacter chinensis TaxID=2282421 RepID=UPI001314331E|nr:hypothetical protein [Pedobacter chinensis]
MFLPLFIAILLGLVNPSTTNTHCASSTTTVNVNGDPGDEDPGNEDPGDDTGGEQGHIPPRNP